MSKPFWKTAVKDWGVINFVQDKIGEPLKDSVLTEIAGQVARSNPIGAVVMDLIQGDTKLNDKFTKDDFAEINRRAKVDQKVIDAEIELAKIELQMRQATLEDRANARDAEAVRMKSDSAIIRHFTYIIAIILLVGAFGLLGILIFKDVPDENMTLFNVAFGYVFGAFTSVIAYYFGDTDKARTTTR